MILLFTWESQHWNVNSSHHINNHHYYHNYYNHNCRKDRPIRGTREAVQSRVRCHSGNRGHTREREKKGEGVTTTQLCAGPSRPTSWKSGVNSETEGGRNIILQDASQRSSTTLANGEHSDLEWEKFVTKQTPRTESQDAEWSSVTAGWVPTGHGATWCCSTTSIERVDDPYSSWTR